MTSPVGHRAVPGPRRARPPHPPHPAEAALHHSLIGREFGSAIRLEQEQIGYSAVQAVLVGAESTSIGSSAS
jgi:hypothetical protein